MDDYFRKGQSGSISNSERVACLSNYKSATGWFERILEFPVRSELCSVFLPGADKHMFSGGTSLWFFKYAFVDIWLLCIFSLFSTIPFFGFMQCKPVINTLGYCIFVTRPVLWPHQLMLQAHSSLICTVFHNPCCFLNKCVWLPRWQLTLLWWL